MSNTYLTYLTGAELSALIRTKQVSPVEVMAHFFERIDLYNDELKAFITTVPEMAMAEAHRAEAAVIAGDPLGSLHGVPIGVKDLDETMGIRTTYGSHIYSAHIPKRDSIAVERIKAAGAIIVGKTNTPDFGWKGTTESMLAGTCINPWSVTRTSGGSSGGSGAALAARLVPICNGSDAGGSIRIPASYCGVYGIKPTKGRVPSDYTQPLGWSALAQNGPMTTDVRDSAMLLNALAGPDGRDPRALPQFPPDFTGAVDNPSVKGMRIAWSPSMDDQPIEPEVRALTTHAMLQFESMGADIEETMPPVTTEDAIWTFVTLMHTDLALALSPAIETGQGDFLPSQVLRWITEALRWPASRYSQAMRQLEWYRHWFDRFFDEYDLLAMPTVATTAFAIDKNPRTIDGREVHPAWGFTPFCLHANLTGRPAASIPCGFDSTGLPVGLMLVGHLGDEATVLRASAAFEQSNPWKDRLPTGFS